MTHALIIPTHRRPQFLKRALASLRSQRECLNQIVVADSSPREIAEENQAIVSTSGLSVEYLRFEANLPLFEKIAQAVEASGADLATVLADDDFSMLRGVLECCRFLDNNPEYSAACGYTLVVRRISAGVLFTPYAQNSVLHESATQRLQAHLGNYTPTFYATQRSRLLVDHLRLAVQHTREFRFGELFLSALTVLAGKVALLDELFLVREDHQASVDKGTQSWSAFAASPEFRPLAAEFVEILGSKLATKVAAGSARLSVSTALATFLSRAEGASSLRTRIGKLRTLSIKSAGFGVPALLGPGSWHTRVRTAWRWANASVPYLLLNDPRVDSVSRFMTDA